MRIGIIGAGNIGGALGRLWRRAGHEVTFGLEHPEKADHLAREINAAAATVGAAIKGVEAVAVAIPFRAWPAFAREHGPALDGKVVLDATNTDDGRDGAIVDEVSRAGEGSLRFVARLLPGARLVKAFNTFESTALAEGAHRTAGGRLAHPVAGDDPAAVAVAARLVRDAGFDAVVAGDATAAKNFDRGASVWNRPTGARDLAAALGVAEHPAQVANAFFAAYADNDAPAMAAMCGPDARIDYVPMRPAGAGKVADVGGPLWGSYFQAFRDFRPEVEDMWVDERRRVAVVRTTNRGVQVGEVAGIPPAGRRLAAPHLFQLALSEAGLITRITAWWDNQTIFEQIGQPGAGR